MNRQNIASKIEVSIQSFVGLAATICVVIVLSISIASALEYSITDLGTLPGGTQSYANNINNSGQVVGYSNISSGSSFYAVLFSDGIVTNLGTLPGGTESFANCINSSGQVVGNSSSIKKNGDGTTSAVLFKDGKISNLGYLSVGLNQSTAHSINDAGQAVGGGYTVSREQHAVIFKDDKVMDFGTLSGGTESSATSVNNSGQAVGQSWAKVGNSIVMHAALFTDGTVIDLGALQREFASTANCINSSGQVVGWAETIKNGIKHAVLFSDGKVTDLAPLGEVNSEAYSINNSGLAVGYTTKPQKKTNYNVNSRAALFVNDTVYDLNSFIDKNTGWTLLEARSINDTGQIVGYGTIGFQTHAFLLTPISE